MAIAQWCRMVLETKCLYSLTTWKITKAMKCSECRLYVFSEGVQGTLAFRKCASLGQPALVGGRDLGLPIDE